MRRAASLAARLGPVMWLLACGAATAQPAPVLLLPGAGAVTAVIDTRERDGFDQRLRYAGGDGRNHAEIALRRETADLLLAFPPRLAKPSEFGIAGEIAVRFPGQAMTVRPPLRNAYGPIGIALGADCLYAWQWIEGGRSDSASGGQPPALFQAEPIARRRAISLRIRLCRTAEASLGDLVRAVEGLRIALPGTRLPPAAARIRPRRPAPKAVARRPGKPVAAEAETPETPSPRKQPPAPPPSPPQTPVAPPPALPPIASPDQKRYIVPPTPQSPAPVLPEAGNQRYITDGGGTGIAPKPAPGQAPGETFFRDLPPEAYRPPSAR